jgi:hypothetical protein
LVTEVPFVVPGGELSAAMRVIPVEVAEDDRRSCFEVTSIERTYFIGALFITGWPPLVNLSVREACHKRFASFLHFS